MESEYLISVAVPRPLKNTFTYKVPPGFPRLLRVGDWVKVPFGRSTVYAFVVEGPERMHEKTLPISFSSLKTVIEVCPEDWVFPSDIWALCVWAKNYYFNAFGEVLKSAMPSTSLNIKKSIKKSIKKKIKKSFFKNYPFQEKDNEASSSCVLTIDQKTSLETLETYRSSGAGKVALLYGVTGSGKTEVYIELARQVLKESKGVLIMVPEIALTSQLYERFQKGLGVPIALWHSAVSSQKRRDQVESLKKGDIHVVVGARSSIFAPIQDLGLIVVDEEHDATYKQEDRTHYHARDLAIVRAKQTGCFALLGTATPSMETRERVRQGSYLSTKLNQRISQSGQPQIEVIDLKVEEKVQSQGVILAVKTIQVIQKVIAAGEQVIIYLNRRGFAAFLLCKDCGDVLSCPQCSVSLSVHKKAHELRCHICGYFEKIPFFCLHCKGTDLCPMGAGTERLEEELPQWIEGLKILRLDRDQITSAKRLDSILNRFREGEANLLLGTQMLVKGHDFSRVTLVVVMMADALWRWPDFRSSERALQVLMQVSGRAGRGDLPGKVLIQAYDTANPLLDILRGKLDLEVFLEQERDLRCALHYPPFGRLARLRFENRDVYQAKQQVQQIAQGLKETIKSNQWRGIDILGPSEAFLKRAKNLYRWDLLLKARKREILEKALNWADAYSQQNKWAMLIEIDPYSL